MELDKKNSSSLFGVVNGLVTKQIRMQINKQKGESSISRHIKNTGPHMNWEGFKIVWQDSNSYE